ncbi:flavodoxin FldB [Ktedonobacter racemifer DSM 44963]|uniref:Flavodoxin FldB n=1 Tax=Ktedonobacter racemifer DSM 44963 TaxID=485913 RepID=D6TQ42_KTERA|nr:flavodoxin FldB [Ktedonobacter racemifer DSM 44963]
MGHLTVKLDMKVLIPTNFLPEIGSELDWLKAIGSDIVQLNGLAWRKEREFLV